MLINALVMYASVAMETIHLSLVNSVLCILSVLCMPKYILPGREEYQYSVLKLSD